MLQVLAGGTRTGQLEELNVPPEANSDDSRKKTGTCRPPFINDDDHPTDAVAAAPSTHLMERPIALVRGGYRTAEILCPDSDEDVQVLNSVSVDFDGPDGSTNSKNCVFPLCLFDTGSSVSSTVSLPYLPLTAAP